MLTWFKVGFKEISLLFRNKYYTSFAFLATRYGGRKRYTPTTMRIDGVSFRVPDALSVVWQYYEIFFKQYYSFNSSGPSPRILDIGSNVGLSIYYFKKKFPDALITGFEADPAIYQYAQENILKNISSPVELIQKAVWINNDGIYLTQEGADGGSIMTKGASSILIPSVSLKEILSRESSVDMIKMDIEGAETDVLLHASDELYKVKNMFVEYHSFKGQKQRMGDLLYTLEKAGFTYCILDTQFFKKASEGQIDLQCNLFCTRAQ